MPNVNCAVMGCSNSMARIKRWKKDLCSTHKVTNEECICERPFKLYCFPSLKNNLNQRQLWIQAMRRENPNKSHWTPTNTHRVCSKHFVDKVPTPAHPLPTEELGYSQKQHTKRREIFKSNPAAKYRKQEEDIGETSSSFMGDLINDNDNAETPNNSSFLNSTMDSVGDHSYSRAYGVDNDKNCQDCDVKGQLIKTLVDKVNVLSLQNKRLMRQRLFSPKTSAFTWKKIKDDKKMNFYTGIPSIALFNTVFLLLQQYLPNVKYWQGPKKSLTRVRFHHKRNLSQKKMTHRDEFLLTLIRLNILNEDLADRFGISPALCSRTFTTWIKIISKVFGTSLVVWLPRESIKDNLPASFRKAGYHKARVIIDCTEVFIERPKSLKLQYATWSEYKHHNTIKFLIGISPSGFVTFLSDCYGGRKTDKFITMDSGFYSNLERGDQVMADRGFQIKDELLHHFCELVIPPGARVKSQMTEQECKKTKEVANLRIHVERAINRLKFYRILKNILPITMLQHSDDIVRSCAALCNIKPLLIQNAK